MKYNLTEGEKEAISFAVSHHERVGGTNWMNILLGKNDNLSHASTSASHIQTLPISFLLRN